MGSWGINSYAEKRKEFRGKAAKGTGRKRMNTQERKTEDQIQEKEGKGVPKFVSCLMITLKSTKEKAAEGKELSRISEGK